MRLYSSSARSKSMRACSNSCFRRPASALCETACAAAFCAAAALKSVLVIGWFDFRQQLSFAYMLALFDQHPGYPATDQESYIGGFRAFDRTTGRYRFEPLHHGWGADLNWHRSLLGSRVGFVAARSERRNAPKQDQRSEDMAVSHRLLLVKDFGRRHAVEYQLGGLRVQAFPFRLGIDG